MVLLEKPYNLSGKNFEWVIAVENYSKGKHIYVFDRAEEDIFWYNEYWITRNGVVEDYDHIGAEPEAEIHPYFADMEKPVVIGGFSGSTSSLKDIYGVLQKQEKYVQGKIRGLLSYLSKVDFEEWEEDLSFGYSV